MGGLRGVRIGGVRNPRGEKWGGLCLPKTAKGVHRAEGGKDKRRVGRVGGGGRILEVPAVWITFWG